MKLFTTIMMLLHTKFATSQVNLLFDNKFCLKLSPIALIDIYGGSSVRIGAEAKLYKNIATALDISKYYQFKLGSFASNMENTTGFSIRPEIKIYLNNIQKTNGDFLAVEYFYKKMAFDFSDSIKLATNVSYFKEYAIHKNISGINLKYGELQIFNSNLILEWYVGGGVRFTSGYNTLTKQEADNIVTTEESGHNGLIMFYERGIFKVLFNVSVGLKIGYSFK
jgi:hypothetical protein